MANEVQGGADISECGRYRYRLWRDGWAGDDDRACLFVMLNPSTADAMTDDPTIRKCVGFCKRWGYGMLMVVNLFAFRSTKPAGLLGVDDPCGPENDAFIRAEADAANRIVLAWGSHPEVSDLMSRRRFEVRRLIEQHWPKTIVLGRAKDGNPRHPLMLAYETVPENVRALT